MAEGVDSPANAPVPLSKPRKRFVGASAKASSSKLNPRRVANQVPDDILNDPALAEAMKGLPSNYNFEIHKTIHHIRRDGVKAVALQMPEGLMLYGCAIADIIETFTGALPMLLADVTYGACCIDDYTAKAMGAEMIVHYGHSCLIPVSQTTLKTLYVFVEITIDAAHLALSVRRNFPSSRTAFHRAVLGAEAQAPGAKIDIEIEAPADQSTPEGNDGDDAPTRIALVSTIQFVSAVQSLRTNLLETLPEPEKVDEDGAEALAKTDSSKIGVWRGKYEITVPQSKPLSPGEILGCTAPKLKDIDCLIYVGDGRFHLESIMIANPTVPAFRFDPYSKRFTREHYEHKEMRSARADAVKKARKNLENDGGDGAGSWGVVLGTLGRQGSLSVLQSIIGSLPNSQYPPYLLLLSELSPAKLGLLPSSQLSTFVQTSCPRLSIDWGYAFERPLLSPYEASVAVGRVQGWEGLVLEKKGKKHTEHGEGDYPMDFYSDASKGPWTPRHKDLVQPLQR